MSTNEKVYTRKPGTDKYTILTPVATAYPHFVTPQAYKAKGGKGGSGEPSFSGEWLFKPDSAELQQIKAIMAKIVEEKWPGRTAREMAERKAAKAAGLPVPGNHLRYPLKSGDTKDKPFYKGFTVLTARAYPDNAPRLSQFVTGTPINIEDENKKLLEKKLFYHGVETVAQFYFKTYEGEGKGEDKARDGVSAKINMVCSTGRGAKLPGADGPNPAEVFKGSVGHVSTEDPTVGQYDDDGEDVPY